MEVINNLLKQTAFFQEGIDWRNYVMILVAFVFLYFMQADAMQTS